MGKTFLVSFTIVALIYAVVGGFTRVFYKNKSRAHLSLLEMKTLRGEATITDKLLLFMINFCSSIVAPPVYILAGIATLIAYFIF